MTVRYTGEVLVSNPLQDSAGPARHVSRWPLHTLVLIAAIILIGAVYIQAAFFDFAYDDTAQIVNNQRIHNWKYAASHFTSHVWAQNSDTTPLYYRPVFMLWLMANYSMFGLNPMWWHLAAVALHLLCCLLVYAVLRELTMDVWTSAASMLLFGMHPAHVESVVWISGATEPLLGVLFLGSVLCYLKHRNPAATNTDAWFYGSLALALLAVLAKESALVLPAVIFSYEWLFPGRPLPWRYRVRAAVSRVLPFVLVSITFLVMRAAALGSAAPPRSTEPLWAIVLGWPKVVAFYLGHLLFPFKLTVFYDLVVVHQPGLRNFAGPLLLCAASAAAAYYGTRNSPRAGFLALWGVILLVPVVNVTLWDNVENIHDRYLYLPSVGFCALLAMLLMRLPGTRFAIPTAVALITLAYAVITIHESRYWADDGVLAQRGLEVSPGHAIATQLLGFANMRAGKFADAVPLFLQAIEMRPQNAEMLWSLGLSYSEIGMLPEAENYALRAKALGEQQPRMYLLLGRIHFKQHQVALAEAEMHRAIELQQGGETKPLYHYYLANVLYAKGDLPGALTEYRLELLNDSLSDPAVPVAKQRIDEIEGRIGRPSQ